MNTKSSVLIAAATLVAGIGCGAAHAQDTQKVQKPFAVKLGGFFPTDGDIKDSIGSTFFYAGLSYDVAKSKATNPALYQVYFDYATKKKDGLEFRVLGIGPAVKFLLAPATAKAQPFVGAGIGYYNAKISASLGNGVSVSESKSRFGGKVFAGYQLKGGFFGEADYTYVSEIEGTKPGGFGLRAGYRF